MFRIIRFIALEKKTDILILNVKMKNLCNLSNEKTQLLSLITGVLGRDVGGGGDRNLHKWNRGNMLLT